MSELLVVMGLAGRPHGIKGWIKMRSYADSVEVFEEGRPILWRRGEEERTLVLEGIRAHQTKVLVKFQGLDTIEAAEGLRGGELCLKRQELPEADPDEVYLADLIDFEVVTQEGKALGRVTGFSNNRVQDILVVGGKTHQILIPAVPSFLVEVDFKKRLITVSEQVEGLLELNAV